jgi:aminoglycoside phosphotransferase
LFFEVSAPVFDKASQGTGPARFRHQRRLNGRAPVDKKLRCDRFSNFCLFIISLRQNFKMAFANSFFASYGNEFCGVNKFI